MNRLSGLVPSRADLFFPFEQAFNKIFDEFFSDGALSTIRGKAGYPRLDILTSDGKWIVEAALPGVEPEDVTVEILPGEEKADNINQTYVRISPRMLKVSGKMSEDHQYTNEAKYHVKELRRSSFERSMTLPDYVEGEPEATMKNGILSLTWKVPELKVPERKTIPIKKLDDGPMS